PALGFFDVYPFKFSYVADHYQYLASAALLALLAAGFEQFARWYELGGDRIGVNIGWAVVLLVLAMLTAQHARTFRDALTFWGDNLAKNPTCWPALNGRGHAQMERHPRKALEDFSRAIELKPDYAEAYNNRGRAHAHLGEYSQAIEDFSQAIR